MTDSQGVVAAVIEQFRPGFQADGADLVLEEVSDGVAHVRLIYGPQACEECVLPPDALAEHLLALLRDEAPELTDVIVREERPG